MNKLFIIKFFLLFKLIIVLNSCGGDSDSTPPPGGGVVPTNYSFKIDEFIEGDAVAFQNGFVTSEEGAVTLGPVVENVKITKVILLFGGNIATQTITLNIYYDTNVAAPGSLIFSNDYVLSGNNSTLQEIDLSANNVIVLNGNSFRVSIQFNHSGAPSIASDTVSTIVSGKNWLNLGGSGWVDAADAPVNLPNNLIIRADAESI